jgi:phosphatidylglycerophosphate synthase
MVIGPLPGKLAVMTAALLSYGLLAAVLLVSATRFGTLRSFGAANTITAVRLGLAALLIGMAFDAATTLSTWWPAALAGLAWLLDGLDGAVARRFGRESRFGALFDQESDALLILVLTLLLAVGGKVGYWIVAAGLMRYVLLAVGRVWPWLATPLPKSRFRSVVCAIMVGALVVCLVPPLATVSANTVAGIALLVLTLSFGKDLIWLLKNARGRMHA